MTSEDKIQELINLSKNGDKTAFGELINTYQNLVYSVAFRLVANEDFAKDIAQETFLRVWLNLHKYNKKYKFSTWIYKIATNICYDFLRKHKQKNFVQIDIESVKSLIISKENVEEKIINEELKSLILYFTNELSPKQKIVFTLSDIEDLETDEIEKITGLSAEKIKSNLYLARKNIKEKLNNL
jgi:RNA polymerase sigma-70 factor (ECF subfamily)